MQDLYAHAQRVFGSADKIMPGLWWLAMVFLLAACLWQPTQAQTYRVIHDFTGGADGAYPRATLTLDRAGNFYGTAGGGGAGGNGTVFKLTHSGSGWVLVPVYRFQGGYDGSVPWSPVTMSPDGTLFGTTLSGGYFQGEYCAQGGCGLVYNLKPGPRAATSALAPWTQSVLRAFTGPPYDGDGPVYGTLILDQAGNLYGTTQFGGPQIGGVVFELTPSPGGWSENILYTFPYGFKGGEPYAGVVMDSAGNLYGTSSRGGLSDVGTVYELSPTSNGWTETVLHGFGSGNDGRVPYGGLIFDQAGNLYGATALGGTLSGGVVYELSPSSNGWTYKVLYNLPPAEGPFEDLSIDASGSLYGTSNSSGTGEAGMVFKLSQSNGNWILADLHDFTFSTAYFPYGGVTIDADGNLYGTAPYGGAYGYGVIWEITP